MKLLEVKKLKTCFATKKGEIITALDGISFDVDENEVLGIVGESGCGKSVTSLSIMRLISQPGFIKSGEIIFKGNDILKISEAQMRKIRGNDISMVFQEPMTALNPFYTCGNQIVEVLQLHQHMNKREARERTIELLKQVGIPMPEKRIDEYPHKLSGGMRQRIMIAIALACSPQLLIADEPTTALDVTIQAQILELMKKIQRDRQMSIIMITHDLGVIKEMAKRVIVMYAGKIVEEASSHDLFKESKHPYTKGLIESMPQINSKQKRLNTIDGVVPYLLNLPCGCRFSPRCKFAKDICRKKEPELINIENGRQVACWLYDK